MFRWVTLGWTTAILSVFASAVHAQSYLIYPSQAACLARSQAMCAAMKCGVMATRTACGVGP